MILEKQLTIKEILKEMKRLKSKIYFLETSLGKRIVPLKGITYKDILTKGGGVSDIMTINLIKTEELRNEIDSNIESYYSYRAKAIEEIQKMAETKTVGEMIVFYRDELKWTWREVCKATNYSRAQANRKYKEIKNCEHETL